MASSSEFQSVPISGGKNFSWVFLLDWILLVVLCLSVIFYVGRAIAYITSLILEWLLWKRAHIKVNIESLRISLLGGRIFFKNVTIIHKDYTISLLQGTLTWRYWLLKTRKPSYHLESKDSNGVTMKKNEQLPCRFVLHCEGAEIFVYNRTWSYDNIINLFSKEERIKFQKFLDEQIFNDHSSYSSKTTNGANSSTGESNSDTKLNDEDFVESGYSSQSTYNQNNDRIFDQAKSDKDSLFLQTFPVEIEVHRASLAFGNKFTPSLVIISSEHGTGIIDYCQPKEKLDLYKMKLAIETHNFAVTVKPNIGYKEEMLLKFKIDRGKLSRLWKRFTPITGIITRPLGLTQRKKKRNEPPDLFIQKWQGLSLYKGTIFEPTTDDLDDIQFDFLNHEYAKFSSVVKCPKAIFTYEYDIPGCVPHGAHPTNSEIDGPDVGNNGAPPTHSLDIQIFGGSICYGPWTQRQMNFIHSMLAPAVSRTESPVKRRVPGSTRIYTATKLSISIMDDTTWRIATREPSKDNIFLKHYKETNDDYRPFGWIDLRFSKESYAYFTFALVPTTEGFKNDINIHLAQNEIRSSVNHDILMKCKFFDFDIDVSYPLVWNDRATWTIDMNSNQLETFLLREHITLIADTLTDFTSGEPTPYELFRPSETFINWKMDAYFIYLNVNDHNIVNNPLDFNENCYLSLHGDDLLINVTIPSEDITAQFNEITYNITTPMFRLLLNTPPWNTLNEFMKYKEVGRSYDFSAKGSYLLYSELDVDNVDTISIICESRGTTLQCYGFVIRYLANVKMNYFGDFFNFITSEEYTGITRDEELEEELISSNLSDNEDNGDVYSDGESGMDDAISQEIPERTTLKRSDLRRTANETDLFLTFSVWDGAIILPETIYNCDNCTALKFGELIIDLRSSNYYMDLLASLEDTVMERYTEKSPIDIFKSVLHDNRESSEAQGFLSDLSIHGHRMFGLPPNEPTYFCKWDFDIGVLNVNSEFDFLKGFLTSFSRIGFGFKDLENILLYSKEVINDMTSLTVNAQEISVNLKNEVSGIDMALKTQHVNFTSIDFESANYSSRLDLIIPSLKMSMYGLDIDGKKARLFNFTTKVHLTDFAQKKNFKRHRSMQRNYITLNDAAFHRTSFLLPQSFQKKELYNELYGSIVPSSSLPVLALPILPKTVDFILEDFLGEYVSLLDDRTIFRMPFGSTNTPNQASTHHEEDMDPLEFSNSTVSTEKNYQCDNLVIDIEYISVEINPSISTYIESLSSTVYEENIVQVIDDIEIETIKILSTFQEGTSSITNIKLRVLYSDIYWGERDRYGIELYLDKLDFEMSQRNIEKDREKGLLEITMLAKTRSIRASISEEGSTKNEKERPPALSLVVEGCELWSATAEKQVNSIDTISTDITIDESQLEWLFLFVNEQNQNLQNIITTLNSVQAEHTVSRRKLISKLTAANDFYQISHDPYVITKPAFITRLSKGHVRENRSWKIITRLRHILTYIPSDWESGVENYLKEKSLNDQDEAKKVFMSVFSNWRNWEFSDVARSYIYGRLFLTNQAEKHKQSMRRIIKVNLSSFFLTSYTAGYDIDQNFVLTNANIVFEQTPPFTEAGVSREKLINLTGSIGSVKGNFSDELLRLKELIPLLNKEQEKMERSPSFQVDNIPKSFKLNALLLFEKTEVQLVIGESKLTNRILNGKVSLLLDHPKEAISPAGSIILYAKRSETLITHRNTTLVENQVRDFSLSATVESWSSKPTVLVSTQCAHFHIKSMAKTATLVNSVKEMVQTVKNIDKQLSISDRLAEGENKSPKKKLKDVEIEVVCQLSNVSFEIMPISPFYIRHETKKFDLKFKQFGSQNVMIDVWDTDFFLRSDLTKQQYFRISFGDFQITYNLIEGEFIIVDANVSASMIKLTFSEPNRILSSFLQDERTASESFKLLKALKPFLLPQTEGRLQPATTKEMRWLLDTDIKYFGILVPISTTYFVFETHALVLSMSDIDTEKYTEKDETQSQVSIENVVFLIKDRGIPSALSRMLDFSISFSTIQKMMELDTSFQVESNHFRIFLSPYSLVRLVWGGQQFLGLANYYKEQRGTDLWDIKASKLKKEKKGSSSIGMNMSSFHVLSYNFCIGWMFPEANASAPGIMLGFSRLFSAYEGGYGKLTLVDAFFSVARGATSATFYPRESELESVNRSYLPNMQIAYWVKKSGLMKDVFIRFHGEALDVSFLTTFITVIESMLQSFQVFQELKTSLIQPNTSTTENNTEPKIKSLAPFLSNIKSVNCQFKYDGGVFKVFSFEDIESHLEPSFELKTPGVIIDFNYKHNIGSLKPHWIRALVAIGSTHNTLFAVCAPLIAEFLEHIHEMVKKHSSNTKHESIATNLSKAPSQNIDYKRLLDGFDIAFKLTSSEQKLSLSCEPKAKVQADVGFDSFIIGIVTNNLDETEPLTFSLSIKKTKASIKHIFSKETSTSFGLDLIDLNFMFTHPDIINMYGTGLISEVDLYFNVKQLQNLYLFIDIWKLSSFIRPGPKGKSNNGKRENKHLTLPQPSNLYGEIPWSFTLIFTNINGSADLGPSLGVLSLKLKRTWVASDHYQDKRQVIRAFTDYLSFVSKGRLSGIFELDGASWMSEVSWPKEKRTHNYPLVNVSVNIDNLSLKAAFDYHMFLIGTISTAKFSLHSEKDIVGTMPDLLKVNFTCEMINICSTALVAANILDLYNTVMRMRQDNKILYLETLRESDTLETRGNPDNYRDILRSLNLLQTDVSTNIHVLKLQVSPIALFDLEVLVINIENISARAGTFAGEKLKTILELEVYDGYVALSTSKREIDEDTVSAISVADYMEYASKISGGTIIEVPKLNIAMTSWQEENSDILEYLYKCTFEDKIAVKWNLGPVNFIKEMWTTHVKALAVRRSQNVLDTDMQTDEEVQKRIKEEENISKLKYVPIEEPRIDMPQIRDLGDATPPLEWFGVNRKRLPAFTHQTVVVPVQKLVHAAEKQYASLLDNSG
ncbi:hypothetical protein KAFR_0B02720 [Kazachstania africana CBS 2517]|uniref:Elongation factor 2 n=1 Tax=Kazachstania africana (strain ATCC 22294 / BCRC 22015 / CBS 2517 / CECT 1963 / NBRC 1671 / NRRL Y-8276) TaxID=1071382 RepID=H2AQB9_KAZAF|nr:hypothetical protein KAFR_0B02720 [Kazachstania africana CBS 2517]CCF56569.1 hypothetical protein KAFR_0B02720 [Kazachstania africana CBS 2517]